MSDYLNDMDDTFIDYKTNGPVTEITDEFIDIITGAFYKVSISDDRNNNEKWINMNEYPGYWISSFGRVLTKTGKLSNLNPRSDGYIRIGLVDSLGRKTKELVHRLVAKYFISNPYNKKFVNHIDGNRSNNKINNLEWVTAEENSNKIVNPNYGMRKRKVVQCDILKKPIKIFDTVEEACNNSGFCNATFHKYINKDKPLGFYYWYYYNENINNEIWINIIVNNFMISVSSEGRIKLPTGNITYGSKTDSGYYSIMINNKIFRVHRIICFAFKPIENHNSMVVNHINGDKSNNSINNLEWVTESENMYHSYTLERKKGCNKRKILQFDYNGIILNEYNSIFEASLKTGVSKGNISTVCKGLRNHAGGFIWRYKNEF